MSGWACLTTSLSRQPHRIPSSRDRPGVGWPNTPSIGVCELTHKRFTGTGLGWAPSSSRTRRRRLSALPRESCRLVSRDQPANDPQRTCKSVEVRRRSAVQSLRTTRAAPALTRRRAARRPSSGPALLHIAPAMSRAPRLPRACQASTVRLVSCAGASRRERSCGRPRHPLRRGLRSALSLPSTVAARHAGIAARKAALKYPGHISVFHSPSSKCHTPRRLSHHKDYA